MGEDCRHSSVGLPGSGLQGCNLSGGQGCHHLPPNRSDCWQDSAPHDFGHIGSSQHSSWLHQSRQVRGHACEQDRNHSLVFPHHSSGSPSFLPGSVCWNSSSSHPQERDYTSSVGPWRPLQKLTATQVDTETARGSTQRENYPGFSLSPL